MRESIFISVRPSRAWGCVYVTAVTRLVATDKTLCLTSVLFHIKYKAPLHLPSDVYSHALLCSCESSQKDFKYTNNANKSHKFYASYVYYEGKHNIKCFSEYLRQENGTLQ